jgi:NodT family efflux transporter outer membrane factor (OMF) lipoprotein
MAAPFQIAALRDLYCLLHTKVLLGDDGRFCRYFRLSRGFVVRGIAMRPESPKFPRILFVVITGAALLLSSGCALREWVRNGFKVGPNYKPPAAPVASDWIDYKDGHVTSAPAELAEWWHVMNDPILNGLIEEAYRQNLTLQQAGARILQFTALRGISIGNLFPQLQQAEGNFARRKFSQKTANVPPKVWVQEWDGGFQASWELDFWGRFRRAVESASADLDASIDNYDDVLVILLSDVSSTYVQLRQFQARLAFARDNVRIQTESQRVAEERLRKGAATRRDVEESKQILAQTRARIPDLEAGVAQSSNLLCVLLGIPPEDLSARLGEAPIPTPAPEVAIGIPADLIRRRPDVRRAERLAASQSARIGIAKADFYPRIAINGIVDFEAQHFKDLFNAPASMFANVGPGVQWSILNYGRILNNVRTQDAIFQQAVLGYQQQVLTAGREVEDAVIRFLKSMQQARELEESVRAAYETYRISFTQFNAGATDFTSVFLFESVLAEQQDQLAQVRGNVVLNMIAIYRALGGGWEMRFLRDKNCVPAASDVTPPTLPEPAKEPERLPKPRQIP